MPVHVRSYAPGRVNLIGDHTDHSGGLVLPMAIDAGITVELERRGGEVRLRSSTFGTEGVVPLTVQDPRTVEPEWARYLAGVVSVLRPVIGGTGTVTSTLPAGAGLSSSAALEVAIALALGAHGSPLDVAQLAQEAEHRAVGVPCGVMDQLASTAGVAGHLLLIDCTTFEVEPIALPDGAAVWVVDSGQRRALVGSEYAARRDACEQAAQVIGPLRDARLDDLGALRDRVLRRRARHVITENARVRATAEALRAGDLRAAGRAMGESHRSLRDDFEVSTAALDELVARLAQEPGVHGARLTGAGFGGSVVVLADAGVELGVGRRVRATDGARVEVVPVP